MEFSFYKMHGLGNDFVVIDMTDNAFHLTPEQVQHLADRKKGVGCDQVLALKPAVATHCDFFYQIYNADGSEVGQCGNGARCIGLLIEMAQLSPKKQWTLQTISAEMRVKHIHDSHYQVSMPTPSFEAEDIPMKLNHSELEIAFQDQKIPFSAVNLGNPHVIINTNDIGQIDPIALSQHINQSPEFPAGANVNFMTQLSDNKIELVVYERGVGLTQACGSGACATYASVTRNQQNIQPMIISQPGGELTLDYTNHNLTMTGPACCVFKGQWQLS